MQAIQTALYKALDNPDLAELGWWSLGHQKAIQARMDETGEDYLTAQGRHNWEMNAGRRRMLRHLDAMRMLTDALAGY